MTFTYDPTTTAGKVRLLCTDKDDSKQIFTDEEIAAFLSMNGNDYRLAAAQALDQIASSQILILKYISANGLTTNGKAVAEALHLQAESLRRQADDGIAITAIAGGLPQFRPDTWGLR
ncbi:hypothetical protein [Methanogenium cariaci]|jgi:hypothetical protein